MGILIDADDFVNKYQISQGKFSKAQLEAYITQYERPALVKLLGKELFDLFVADLTAQVPSDPRFVAIYDPFEIDDSSCVRISEGMKVMLLGMVYFQYVRDSKTINTQHGSVMNNQENSEAAMGQAMGMEQRFNQGLDTYKTIQWYICENDDVYPEENTQYWPYMGVI